MRHARTYAALLSLTVALNFALNGAVTWANPSDAPKSHDNLPAAETPFSQLPYIMTAAEFRAFLQAKQEVPLVYTGPTPGANPVVPVSMIEKTHGIENTLKLLPGDSFRFDLNNLTEFHRDQLLIGDNGQGEFPLIGTVNTQGKTLGALIQELTERYQEYLHDPQVSLEPLQIHPAQIHIYGAVQTPGALTPKTTDATLTQGLQQAGGVAYTADISHVFIWSPEQKSWQEIDLFEQLIQPSAAETIPLMDGAMVYVPKQSIDEPVNPQMYRFVSQSEIGQKTASVKVLGAVATPNVYDLKPSELTVSGALSRAGGLTEKANPKRIQIKRPDGQGNWIVIPVNANNKEALLHPEDLLFVPTK